MTHSKIQNKILISDIYNNYKNITNKNINKKIFIDIFSGFSKFMINKVFEGYIISLPENMGRLSIKSKKNKVKLTKDGKITLPIDWKKTSDIRQRTGDYTKIIYHTNELSDSTSYKFFWSRVKMYIRNKNLFSFQATRFNKRYLKDLIRKGTEYV